MIRKHCIKTGSAYRKNVCGASKRRTVIGISSATESDVPAAP
jgi:hypothetical protein